ncbi:unnamed protein product [Calicophoron daubneyi]|uniref:Dynein light chain n=1 Tax=Calicophoron daubneyi TaxID=300641 RepID=A0AAV2TN82_CALDB
MTDDDQIDVVVKRESMPEEMRQDVIEYAVDLIDKCSPTSTFTVEMKQYMDQKYKPKWHCIMGTHYCSTVSFVRGNFIAFEVNGHNILLFKTP